jgi:hypothetical protein
LKLAKRTTKTKSLTSKTGYLVVPTKVIRVAFIVFDLEFKFTNARLIVV